MQGPDYADSMPTRCPHKPSGATQGTPGYTQESWSVLANLNMLACAVGHIKGTCHGPADVVRREGRLSQCMGRLRMGPHLVPLPPDNTPKRATSKVWRRARGDRRGHEPRAACLDRRPPRGRGATQHNIPVPHESERERNLRVAHPYGGGTAPQHGRPELSRWRSNRIWPNRAQN